MKGSYALRTRCCTQESIRILDGRLGSPHRDCICQIAGKSDIVQDCLFYAKSAPAKTERPQPGYARCLGVELITVWLFGPFEFLILGVRYAVHFQFHASWESIAIFRLKSSLGHAITSRDKQSFLPVLVSALTNNVGKLGCG